MRRSQSGNFALLVLSPAMAYLAAASLTLTLSGRISYATSMSLLLLILTIVVFTILWRTARRLAE